MKLGIYTIEKTLYEGEVDEIIAKTIAGEITVLPDHIPMVSELSSGPLRIKEHGGKEKTIDIEAGFMEIQPESNVIILSD